jgi:hypothetical protein
MVRKNDTVTSEEDSHVEADSPVEPERNPSGTLTTSPDPIPGAFPFPGDTQSGGTRNPAPDFISSNVAEQAKMYGSTIDPATGRTVTLEDLKARGLVVEDATPTLASE